MYNKLTKNYKVYRKIKGNTELKKYSVITYGCQMNIHESEKIAGILNSMGFEPADQKDAEIVVFNTCCIRENAEHRAYGNIGALKPLKKKRKDLIVAVGGCMTQQSGAAEKLKQKFPFVDIIFGTHNLENFRELLERELEAKKTVIDIPVAEGPITEGTEAFRTSYPNAWINIMYGCNNFCSYCIVPYVRGRERSRLPEKILEETETAVKEGYREITFLGQNVNSYGNDLENGIKFPQLLQRAAAIEGKFRIRFMTSHPKDLSEELVKVIAENDKICNCIHLPVQAGSDRILKAMNRKYTASDYLKKTELIRRYMPDCQITTDIMVGFPGETEEDFEDTLKLVEKVKFSSAFTFVYSRRSGTKAAIMPDQVDEEVQKDRIMRLIKKQNEITAALSRNYVGKTAEVLCEGYDEKRGKYLGRDEYGRMVYFNSDRDENGNFNLIKITKANGISLFGEKLEV